MSTFKRLAIVLSAFAISAAAVVAVPSAAQASVPQGASSTVLCPDGSGSCTEYRYGFNVPGTTGQFGIYYTVKWSSSGASYRVTRVRYVNNAYNTVNFGDIGFVYAGHYYQLRKASTSVASGSSASFTDLSLLGGLSGTGVGKYVPRGSGAYATANPSGVATDKYWVLGWQYSSITGAFVLS